jgi:hypothetical protein
LLGLGAGCGGSGGSSEGRLSKAAYEKKLKSEGSGLKTSLSAAGLGQSENLGAVVNSLHVLQRRLDKAADEIGRLKAPKDAADDNEKLADILHRAGGKVGELAGALKAKDTQRIGQLSNDVQAILQDGRAVANDLKSKGYRIGVLGS